MFKGIAEATGPAHIHHMKPDRSLYTVHAMICFNESSRNTMPWPDFGKVWNSHGAHPVHYHVSTLLPPSRICQSTQGGDTRDIDLLE